MSRRRARRAKRRQRRRIIIASVALGSALFAFVSAVLTDDKHRVARERLGEREVAGSADGSRPGRGRDAQAQFAGTRLSEVPQAFDSGIALSIDYIASDYQPVYGGLDDSVGNDLDPSDGLGSIADDESLGLGGAVAQTGGTNGAGRSKRSSSRRGQRHDAGGAGFGGFGSVGGGPGVGSGAGVGVASEQPSPGSILTGLNLPTPQNSDSISQEVAALGAPNFASLPANFDPCPPGGLVVSPCVSPAIDPCPSDGAAAASCSSGESDGDVRRSVASVNGGPSGRGGSAGGEEGAGTSGQSGGSDERDGGNEIPDNPGGGGGGGGGGDGDGDEIVQIVALAEGEGDDNDAGTQSSGDDTQTTTDDDETRSPYASTDLRPLLISGGVDPDLTDGNGPDGDEDDSGDGGSGGNSNGVLTTASVSTSVPVPAPALLLGFGLALLIRRR
ncbi:MAG: hypothetical protein AAGI72_00165 [Pseudomonadota bacterium]